MYWKKNAYSPVSRTQYIGAQSGEWRPNRRLNKREGRKCSKCGSVLSKQQGYVTHSITQNRLCLICYRKTKHS